MQEIVPAVYEAEKALEEGHLLCGDPIIEKQKELLRYQTAPPLKRGVKFISRTLRKILDRDGAYAKYDFFESSAADCISQAVTKHLERLEAELTKLEVCSQLLHHSLC